MDPIPGFEEHTTDSIGGVTDDKEDEKNREDNKSHFDIRGERDGFSDDRIDFGWK